MINSKAKWIWISDNPKSEEYGFFKESFMYENGKVVLKIAAETDYIAYINGKMVSFSQFPGYPFEKYYDEIDVTKYCDKGTNEFSVTVRYEGAEQSATHIEDGAGVIFTIEEDGKLAAFSSKETLGGFDNRYIQHQKRFITVQLGYASGMKTGEAVANSKCVEVEKTYNIVKRPMKKTQFSKFEKAEHIGNSIYDLGRETAGYLYVKVKAEKACHFKVAYGEHLKDGCVRRIIDSRDFSLDFECDAGEHEFTQYFIRIAGRYLQIESEENIEIISIGVYHYLYPLTEKKYTLPDEDAKIYETCVRTLRLCMNHHYEDCPWREQALYVVDSRNQMLCGYYAFEETAFQRENLVFMSKGTREDGFFELMFPAVNTPSIPFFAIMYPVAVYEYVKYTGDKSILDEVMPQTKTIMENTYKKISKNGLIPDFDKPYWNFYEWKDGLDGFDAEYNALSADERYHLMLSCSFVFAGMHYAKLCEIAGTECDFDFEAIKKAITDNFFNEETGTFANTLQKKKYSQLGNAFALLIGLGDERTVDALKNDETLIPATLSMTGYVYDALLESDFEGNKEYILNDIRKKYNYMFSQGATSFWETILGEADFNNAGSLCHGWSAMPIYYYNKLM